MTAATDDQAAQVDLPAMLAGGLADIDGRLRHRFLLNGTHAAAVQLERAGVSPAQVTRTSSQLRTEALGLQSDPRPCPEILQTMSDAVPPDEHERLLFLEWLDLVAGLMRERAGG